MFEFEVVGLVRGTYTNRKTGSVKPFTRIYCTYPLDDSSNSSCDVEGTGTDVLFLNRLVDDIVIGDKIRPIYNKYGTCVDIQIF